jgi:hypothetical protein
MGVPFFVSVGTCLTFGVILFVILYPITSVPSLYNEDYQSYLHAPTAPCKITLRDQVACIEYKCCMRSFSREAYPWTDLEKKESPGDAGGCFSIPATPAFAERAKYEVDCELIGETACSRYNVTVQLPAEGANSFDTLASAEVVGWSAPTFASDPSYLANCKGTGRGSCKMFYDSGKYLFLRVSFIHRAHFYLI